ncbi:MAG: SAM-dependent methyltransferase [Parvicella sp.]|jgi:SAM-dependent methyltransferase
MDDNAYINYIEESNSWLHKGRKELIRQILDKYAPNKNLDILEVGAGIGQNIPTLKEWGEVDALEINPKGIEALKKIDALKRLITEPIPTELNRRYDVIGAFDVIEHIEDDKAVVEWIYKHLNDDGLVIATVPAYQWFFSDHDRVLGHFRRYTISNFEELYIENFNVLKKTYFNTLLFPLAIISRFAMRLKSVLFTNKNKSHKKQKVPNNPLLNYIFFHLLKMESKLISCGIRMPFGLTVVICAQKKI